MAPPKPRTPIDQAKNLGPVSRAELESLGIDSLEALRALGWEEVCVRWAEAYPARINHNAFTSVIGAIDDVDWRDLSEDARERARALIARLRGPALARGARRGRG